ncbi:hypothetical protein L1987_02663 [Smallanthus sonchifolius]|uniref:Uncharacterized protein n=1 Tax=Smallanthus sonchifolius TaxID=185202 RepID=A0ACB9K8G5_9ASTR|nr:hypothetical protein L1987_02663 [Smallanthus sonchifolius]
MEGAVFHVVHELQDVLTPSILDTLMISMTNLDGQSGHEIAILHRLIKVGPKSQNCITESNKLLLKNVFNQRLHLHIETKEPMDPCSPRGYR